MHGAVIAMPVAPICAREGTARGKAGGTRQAQRHEIKIAGSRYSRHLTHTVAHFCRHAARFHGLPSAISPYFKAARNAQVDTRGHGFILRHCGNGGHAAPRKSFRRLLYD